MKNSGNRRHSGFVDRKFVENHKTFSFVSRMDFVEADMSHAQTPFYVVQNLITTLLQLEGCNSLSEREAKILDYIEDEDLKTELCLLNDLLGTHVRAGPAICVTFISII